MGEQSETTRVRIGEWVVWPSLDRMQRNGERVSLEPLGMALLLHFASNPDRVVSTDELIESVWRGQIVSDGTVYQWIHRLRKALGDDPHRPQYIETIPKKGYRLVASVTFSTAADAASRTRVTQYGVAAAAATVVIAIAAVAYSAWQANEDALPTAAQTSAEPSIAVLPFAQFGDETDDARLATGIHNNLLVQLTKIPGLKVISRSSVEGYVGTGRSVQSIGEELGVAAVLDSSFQRSNDAFQVTAMLIDVASNTNIWGDEFVEEFTAEGLFSIQTELATAIATALETTLTPQDVTRISELPTESLSAWEAYLLGMDRFQRADDRVYMPRAVEYFEQAVAQDPDFALAWAGLSGAHTRMYWYDLDRTPERRARALAAVERAFELSPVCPRRILQ